MDNSSKSKRAYKLHHALSFCDSDTVRINFLIDEIVRLQDELFELQSNYFELLSFISRPCAPIPF